MKTRTLQLRNSVNWLHIRFAFLLIALGCFALLPQAQATCQEGCLTNGNTVLGDDALLTNTGANNTAVGEQTLFSNTFGHWNTAVGYHALKLNTTGLSNTAIGFVALVNNTTGQQNVAVGAGTLLDNTTGSLNTAIGDGTLQFNNGDSNVGIGFALFYNRTGNANTATGVGALKNNTTGNNNTANGFIALGNNNGSNNIALGYSAGVNLVKGDNNIDIGNAGVAGDAGVIRIGTTGTQTATFIAGIRGVPISGGTEVGVNASGQLGVRASSARYKDAIKPMDKESEAILALKPVTFRYKKEIDPNRTPEFGLVAEDVEKVNPDLVVRDNQGKPYSVRYDQVNAMLLNEFLKEHKKVEKQQATIAELKSTVAQQQKGFQSRLAEQQKQLEALTSGLQKVNAQLEASKPAPQVVNNP
jgi:uncharacterized coiled-coil protein SlyX